jgi:hypothetical protein
MERGPSPHGSRPTTGVTGTFPADESFRRSMAELSRQAAERVAARSAIDPDQVARMRRAALQTYERARARQRNLAIAAAIGLIAASCLAGGAAILSSSDATSPAADAAGMPPGRAVSATPSATASPSAMAPSQEVDRPESGQASERPAGRETVAAAALDPSEIREVQTLLLRFGFNPGPIDGVVGRSTRGAVMRYQQERSEPQTGKIDRQLLERLRRQATPEASVAAPVGDRLGRRLQSSNR